MKVSFVQLGKKTKNYNGYGYAREMCERSLSNLGHEVVYLDRDADVEINFIQPHLARWSGCDYRIMYTPWESTDLPDGWLKAFNEVDEVWTPSPVIADIYRDAGVKKPVYVYEHGVEPIWSTNARQRHSAGTFKILHHGAEAARKGGNDINNVFTRDLSSLDARLTLKMHLDNMKTVSGPRLTIIPEKVGIQNLIALYGESDLFAYPSYGEGFGLTPLQAMAGGMPVLITKGWAPYEDMLPEEFLIDSKIVPSPWPDLHPGKMWQPSLDDLRDKVLWHHSNRDAAGKSAYALLNEVRVRYDWDRQTSVAFEHLV